MEKKTMYMIGGGVAIAGIAAYFLLRPKAAVAAPAQKLAAGAPLPAKPGLVKFNPAVSRRFIGLLATPQNTEPTPAPPSSGGGGGFNFSVEGTLSAAQKAQGYYTQGKQVYDGLGNLVGSLGGSSSGGPDLSNLDFGGDMGGSMGGDMGGSMGGDMGSTDYGGVSGDYSGDPSGDVGGSTDPSADFGL